MGSPRYIEVPAESLLGEMARISESVTAKGGNVVRRVDGNEIVFEITPPGRLAFVRVYTSLANGDGSVRACGEDAVRLVLGTHVPEGFKPLAKSRRIYRTAPKGTEEERIRAFIERFAEAMREVYGAALKAPTCHECGKAPMATRSTKDGTRSFLGCVRFPACRGTRSLPAVS